MREVFSEAQAGRSTAEYPIGDADAARIRDGLEGQVVCPFCGLISDGSHAVCTRCTMENSTVARKATKQRIGPWYVLQSRNPGAPGMKWETLLAFVHKARVKPQSIVRGPTTHQLWRFAAHVKGLSREFGICYSCGGSIERGGNLCPHCNRLQEPPAQPDLLLETVEGDGRLPIFKEVASTEMEAAQSAALAAALAAAQADAEAARNLREHQEAIAREQRELIARERDEVAFEREIALREREAVTAQREALLRDQQSTLEARAAVGREKELIEQERAGLAQERELIRQERSAANDAVARAAAAERETAERESAARAAIAREKAALEAVVHEGTARDANARDASAREAMSREKAALEAAVHEAMAREASARDATAREGLAREKAELEAARQEAKARQAMALEAVTREAMARQKAAMEAAVREATARQAAAVEAAAREALAREKAELEVELHEATAREALAREAAAREALAHEKAANEAAAHDAAARDAVAREAAVREALARERAAASRPASGDASSGYRLSDADGEDAARHRAGGARSRPPHAKPSGHEADAQPSRPRARDGFLSARDLAAAFKLNVSPDAEFDLAARPAEAAMVPAPVIQPGALGRSFNLSEPQAPSRTGRKILAIGLVLVFIGLCAAAAVSPDLRQKMASFFGQSAASGSGKSPVKQGDESDDALDSGSGVLPPIAAATQPASSAATIRQSMVPPATQPAARPADPPKDGRAKVQTPAPPPTAVHPAQASEPIVTPAMKAQANALFAKVIDAEVHGDYSAAVDLLTQIEKLPRGAWPEDIEWRRQLDTQTAKNARASRSGK